MEQSAFIELINKYFKGIVIKKTEELNGKANNNTLTYMFKEMLKKEFSVTGKWETIGTINTRVSADIVAMDAQLPLKNRGALRKATGDIPKSGMELWLNETQLTELNRLAQSNYVGESNMVAKIFKDVERVITGVYENNERIFLEGLSTGMVSIGEDVNTGTEVRLDYGYLTENKFGVETLWDDVAAKPLDDLREALKKAKDDGNTITDVYMDDVTFYKFVRTTQVKEFFAFSIGFFGDKTVVPIPTLEKINAALKADNTYRFAIHIVDRRIKVEKNGVRKTITPWKEGMVILTTTTQVGVLVHSELAEMVARVPGVSYQIADEYILVSMYRQNKPLAEFTSSQALVFPVICNVEQIYQVDAKTIQA